VCRGCSGKYSTSAPAPAPVPAPASGGFTNAKLNTGSRRRQADMHEYRTARQDEEFLEEFLHGEDSGEDAALMDLMQ
jgi:hypothetical protein